MMPYFPFSSTETTHVQPIIVVTSNEQEEDDDDDYSTPPSYFHPSMSYPPHIPHSSYMPMMSPYMIHPSPSIPSPTTIFNRSNSYPVAVTRFVITARQNQNNNDTAPAESSRPIIPDQSTQQSTSETHPPSIFRLRMHVDGFLPSELKVSIKHNRLIVRGKHIVRGSSTTAVAAPITTVSQHNDNYVSDSDENDSDFVSKEFKRTFSLPADIDIRKANAHYLSQQSVLVVEIPYLSLNDNWTTSSRMRPIDLFLTIVALLLLDRALRTTFESYIRQSQIENDNYTI